MDVPVVVLVATDTIKVSKMIPEQGIIVRILSLSSSLAIVLCNVIFRYYFVVFFVWDIFEGKGYFGCIDRTSSTTSRRGSVSQMTPIYDYHILPMLSQMVSAETSVHNILVGTYYRGGGGGGGHQKDGGGEGHREHAPPRSSSPAIGGLVLL